MIAVCGVASEAPVAMVTAALDQLGLAYVMLHQPRFADASFDIEIIGGEVRGHVALGHAKIDCSAVTGIYTRLMDWRLLPAVEGAPDAVVAHCQRWHEQVETWIELAPGCVMNRGSACASNSSKPFQAQLIRQAGFSVPETLITNDPELVRDFHTRHGRVVYKSISGVRSIVRFLDEQALLRLPLLRWCPVQFQRYVPGVNVRVHTIAGEVFATRVDTDRVDYRYAHADGGHATLTPWAPSDELAHRCLTLAAQLGLTLAGIDLLLAEDGEVFCFEVNPSPAFSFFAGTGQPMARTIARALACGHGTTR